MVSFYSIGAYTNGSTPTMSMENIMPARNLAEYNKTNPLVPVRMTVAQKNVFRAAAEYDGHSLSGWLKALAMKRLREIKIERKAMADE